MFSAYSAVGITIFLSVCTLGICLMFIPALLQTMTIVTKEVESDFDEFKVSKRKK